MDHLKKLREILADHFEIEPETITPETRFREDLSADSLDMVDIGLSIEESYAITDIPDELLFTIQTVSQLITYLEAT